MPYPPLRFDHVHRLSDSTGMLQHARWTVPDPAHGYTLDDNARAFVVAMRACALPGENTLLECARRYLSFMMYAQTSDGGFRNFAGFDRSWLEAAGSQDSNGRALLALGLGVGHAPEAGMREVCMNMFDLALAQAGDLTSPRAVAAAAMGCAAVLASGRHSGLALSRLNVYAAHLARLYEEASDAEWQWLEPVLTYGNATLPHAMLQAGQLLRSARYVEIGRDCLTFLIRHLFADRMLDVIGNDGWYVKHGERAHFDQQPIDAACLIEALVCASDVVGDRHYLELAHQAMTWFYGNNRNGLPLYDPESGGCRDGLTAEGVNENQGAESTLAHLSARLALLHSDCDVGDNRPT